MKTQSPLPSPDELPDSAPSSESETSGDPRLEPFDPSSKSETCNSIAVAEIPSSNLHSDSQENFNSKKIHFSLWNAVLRGPMRRLHERFLGSRWIPTAEASRSSIWLLGVCYTPCEDGSSSDVTNTEAYTDFCKDFSSRIWFTYRKGFEDLGQIKTTSDVGWGCMLRSGQMLLAQALICHHLGRDWRWNPLEPKDQEYLKILQYFGDAPSEDCPFSIHNIVEAGGPHGLKAGAWLGPYVLCRVLEQLAHNLREKSKNGVCECKLPLEIYVVSGDADGERGGAPCICMDDVQRLCFDDAGVNSKWTPVLLLVPLVLGPEKVNSRYLPSLWATFTFPQSMGIMGGKPGASTYLVGVQDEHALYLDPHETQQVALVSADDLEAQTSSYHCSVVRKMPLAAIDPSLALGFYCRNQDDFVDLCKRATELAKESSGAPMFTVVESNHRTDSIPAEIDLGSEHASTEEDWQIL